MYNRRYSFDVNKNVTTIGLHEKAVFIFTAEGLRLITKYDAVSVRFSVGTGKRVCVSVHRTAGSLFTVREINARR